MKITSPIPLVKVALPAKRKLMPLIAEVLYSGNITEGAQVYEFESQFASKFGLPNALAMSSGSAALHIALMLAGAAPGTEVVTTAMTAEPTNTCISQTGAQPVFADIDPATGNLSPTSVRLAITPRTVAIVVVHYAGYPADLEALRAIADEHDLKLIEDCAHALGATYKSRPIGAWGDSAIFSFQAIKHMTTIDGGILTLKDERLIDEAKQRRWFGLRKGIERSQSNITLQGFKYNMTNVAAVIGLAQLDDISTKIQKHIMHGKFLDALVARTEGVSSARIVDGAQPSYWIYTLLAHSESKADTLINTFNAHKIGASKLHKPNHQHSIFASPLTNLPNTDDFFARLVHVPCGWWLNKQSLKLISSVLTNSQDND